MNAKFLVGGLLGGIVLFLLGWLVYGILLGDTMSAYSAASCMRPEEEFNIVLMLVGNIVFGYLLAYVLSNSADGSSFSGGAKGGAIVGLLTCLSFDLMMYSMTTMWNDFTGIIIDVVVFTVLCAIAGGIIGWWLGRK